MSKHTPGPWSAYLEEAYFVTCPDLGRVAMMMNLKGAHGMGGRRSGEESAANCRLIAAAPELLEALQKLADEYGPQTGRMRIDSPRRPLWSAARAAIAKATGEQA